MSCGASGSCSNGKMVSEEMCGLRATGGIGGKQESAVEEIV